jgi:Ala-tRNA(Pro) deacylase
MNQIECERWTPRKLLDWMESLNIECPTFEHPPLRTVEDSRRYREIHEGAYTKNLFVRNKKGHMWLLTLLEHRRVDLKETAKNLGAGHFSFASEQRLMRHLGIVPGAVSPLALVNDVDGQVNFVLDSGILAFDRIHLHPLDNRMTTTLRLEDLLGFLEKIDHSPQLIDAAT